MINFNENDLKSLDNATKECFISCQQEQYKNDKNQIIPIIGIQNCLEKTEFYKDDYKFILPPLEQKEKGTIEIRNESTLKGTFRMCVIEHKEKVCALNFANGYRPGGGVLYGASAQEETLCRSSALYYSLMQKKASQFYDYHNKNFEKFGNASSDCLIFTPDCPTWIVDGKKIDKPYLTSYITCAAVANNGNSIGINRIKEIHDQRIKKIIDCAIINGVKNIVLGAFGCGEFNNDPFDIVESFWKCLIEDGKRFYFESISFSIIGFNTDNIDAFADIFDLPIINND